MEGQCVVLVGTTGTGKTTCLNIYTGQVVAMMAMMVVAMIMSVITMIKRYLDKDLDF